MTRRTPDDLPAAVLDLHRQIPGGIEGGHLLQVFRLEYPPVLLAHPLMLGLVCVREQRWHQHVGALADLVVDHLIIERRADPVEHGLPRLDVIVVAVREGAIDVE